MCVRKRHPYYFLTVLLSIWFQCLWQQFPRHNWIIIPCLNRISPSWQCIYVYGVIWCCMVWYGVVWCGMVWYGVVWCGMVWYGVVWCGMVLYGVVWCGMVVVLGSVMHGVSGEGSGMSNIENGIQEI